jgi:hypothetical protein
MRLVNLTPHPVTLFTADTPTEVDDPAAGVLASWPVAGPMARCSEIRADLAVLAVDGPDGAPVRVPMTEVGFGEVSDLPEPREGVLFIVSRATAERASGRADVVYPDLQVRTPQDQGGRILGCRALARVSTT